MASVPVAPEPSVGTPGYRVEREGLIFPADCLPHPTGVAAAALLEELEDEGLATTVEEGRCIGWRELYAILDDTERAADLAVLNLPESVFAAPRLVSRGSLTDSGFAVAIDGWLDGDGRIIHGARLHGGTLEIDGVPHLLPPAAWRLVDRVASFGRRGPDERGEGAQRLAWGAIRAEALAVGAALDDFLFRTVVLTPDRLQIALRRSDRLGLVEVEPWFEGAPTHWLQAFDRSAQVRDRYDLVTPDGVVQVMVSPEVGTVLRELKRMPGRRVAGERAQAFLVNPIAALGPDAAEVIDQEAFEAAKEEAGISFDRFAAITPETHGDGALGLLVTSGTGERIETSEISLSDEDALEFVARVEDHLARGLQLCSWDDFEFELDGDSTLHCAALRRAVGRRAASLISHGQIYDLSGYSDRVDGIGEERPFYSPHIARKSDDAGWFPENLVPIIGWNDPSTGEPGSAPLTDGVAERLRTDVEEARRTGAAAVQVPGCPVPMPVREAEAILKAFGRVRVEAEAGTLDPARASPSRKRPTLILKANIEQVDYREERLAALSAPPGPPRLPAGLREEVRLKDHQLKGLAWMQHLFSLAPDRCRGALLADDMGLGKTLQILSLVARAREDDPATPPALVVAPLTLLENWREEAEKFLLPGSLKILTAYGDTLSGLRVGKSSVDEQLRREGLVRFLRPDWRGDADVVLTTYETLRDLEFSFARERWSIMICDEAQKIKNPNAAMTRAAKKQQAVFRIACTGTPVENSLVDLWCLFDFVQPGLLGALNEFGSTYRRPIEAEGDADRAKLEELRTLIEPQILRRMKSEVAADLKAKLVDEASRRLPMSVPQRGLYVGAIEGFRREAGRPGAHLGLLHRLRLICSDPAQTEEAGAYDAVDAYRARSPKLDWLLSALAEVRERGEKAIVFCEFKAVQRLLRHYIREAFAIPVDVINGDTSAAAGAADSRQKRIRAFQDAPGFGVIILSPVAVGFGVNMQAANHVIHFTRTWNPAKEDQATDRAYRIGQRRDVFVYYPTVAADDFTTFDMKLDELLERKRALAGDMLNGTGEIGARDFDVEELRPGSGELP
ncbi:DEAD/DEAH box helicase [Sphingomonas sp. BK345]|uniref:DEAD/DEAH box helicase n=1 Tax=Sphingomonas sp. BK345 TaxID=2586980 RepID=UPI00162064CB|nr:DEAD/DEAH box helicase [Sphingomonas sp. BK345]MBB3473501.1 hypothetical protein [Sphingomonas sp. BK345]